MKNKNYNDPMLKKMIFFALRYQFLFPSELQVACLPVHRHVPFGIDNMDPDCSKVCTALQLNCFQASRDLNFHDL